MTLCATLHNNYPLTMCCAGWLGKVYIIQLTIHIYILLDSAPPSVVKEEVRPENEPECAELFESYLKAAKKEETKTVHSKIQNMQGGKKFRPICRQIKRLKKCMIRKDIDALTGRNK